MHATAGAGQTTATADRPVPTSIRVSNAVAHFAACLPFRVRCSDDLSTGLSWAERHVALLHREIAPDPPGWKTALRFDVDCPCDRQPHARAGYCPRAATYWRDAALMQPSFVVVNPANGHAHYVYLLRGWIRVDGTDRAQLAAVRYFAAIERAYARALRADAGYAGLVQHNPFSPAYETFSGRDEPYSLAELAAYVELPPIARRRTEIRTDGRNVETFDRLRHWAYATIAEYRCGPRETWDAVVDARAVSIAAHVRAAHPTASHPYTDQEAYATGKSVAGWVWSRYDGGNLTRVRADAAARRDKDRKRALAARRTRGSVPRDVYLADVQRRRIAASTLRGLGIAVEEVARRLGAGVRTVHRWIAEIGLLVPSVPGPSAPSDFEPGRPSEVTFSQPEGQKLAELSVTRREGAVDVIAPPVASASPDTRSNRFRAYIQRRILEIVSRVSSERPP